MAAIAVDTSDALVKPVIEKLSTKQWKDLSIFWRLDKTKNMLTIISRVLADDDEKSTNRHLTRHWLLKLQDVAYDVDDLLNILQFEEQRRRNGKFLVGAVQDFFSSNNQVMFHSKMVKKIKKINKRLDKIIKGRRKFQPLKGNIIIEENNTQRETCPAVIESDVYGRKKEKVKITNLLIHGKSDEILSVLPIVGMGGVGKTTIARLVCNDREIKKHFYPIVWVHVAMNFELITILNKMIANVSGKSCDVPDILGKQNKIQSMISRTRFLLVLDDVWIEDTTKWEELKTTLTCGMVGSKILITTRREKVAKIMGTFDQFRVNPLEFKYCWELFEKRAFRHIDEEEKGSLVKIGKEIVRKCKGLPLAAVHLGNLANFGEVDWCTIRDSDMWHKTEYWGGIMPSLALSYFYLLPHLKRCFAYCSLFPKGFEFEKEYLIQLWILEDFMPDSESPTQLESVANSCFDCLVSRSFFEVSGETFRDPHMYKMHDLIHDLACYVAGDEFFLRNESKNKHSTVSYRYSSVFPNDITKIKKLRTILHPACHDVGVKLDSIMQLQYLRVLEISRRQIITF